MPELTELYRPWPKQAEALWLLGCTDQPPPDRLPVNLMLYGGMAAGGKSKLLRMLAAYRAITWPGSHFAIFRKRSDDLVKNHFDPMRQEIPEKYATYNWNRMELTWFNGSVTEFHHCYEDTSHEDYKGYEWGGGVGIDESTDLRSEAISFFFSRIRMPNQPRHWKTMVLATNPLGRSHVWHKINFVDGHASGVPFWGPPQELEMPDGSLSKRQFRHCFLRAATEDNPSLDYADTMAGLMSIADPLQRRAQAFGDWDLPAGQFFSTFNRDVHVVDHRSVKIDKDWRVWRAVDWGFRAPAMCLWGAMDPKDASLYVVKEWMQSEVPTPIQATTIRLLSKDLPPCHLTLADPSMWRKTKGVGRSEAQEYARAGLDLTRANNNRHQGWALIHKLLHYDDFTPPRLRIFDTCPELIKWLANVERSDKDLEDIKEPTNLTDLRDEPGDALRYLTQGEVVVSRHEQGPRSYAYVEHDDAPKRYGGRRRPVLNVG